MVEKTSELEQAVALALTLSPLDRVRLVRQVMATLEADLQAARRKPRKSLLGVLAGSGPAPSAEDIDEMRREMLRNFPREDI